MSSDVWVSVTSLGGVVVGGLLSFLVQARTQRAAERADERRQRAALAEARRTERIARLERFVELTAQAERGAFDRPETDLRGPEAAEWRARTEPVMNQLWVAERMIRLQFSRPVHDAARVYFLDLNRAVWQGLAGGSARDFLDGTGHREAFLDAARAEIDRIAQ